jgi:hypothetical protein
MRQRLMTALAIVCLSGFSVYTSFVVLDHTDPVTNRTFRAVSLEDYRLALSGHGPFPYQWRMLGNWAVAAGERVTGADPHAIDLVLKVTALAVSAWALALFSASLVSSAGVAAVLGLYFALSSAAYASQGYSIYYTADYFMIAGWFWAVYFASQHRWTAMALVVFAAAWAKETMLLAPLLLAMRWRRGRVSFAQLTLVAIAFAVPVAALRLIYRAPIGEWAWWQTIRVNVPFLVWDRAWIARAFRANAKVLLFYNVGWWLAIRALRRVRDPFVTDLALTCGCYLVLAYFVVYLRELRHLLPLAIVILPLGVSEYDR